MRPSLALVVLLLTACADEDAATAVTESSSSSSSSSSSTGTTGESPPPTTGDATLTGDPTTSSSGAAETTGEPGSTSTGAIDGTTTTEQGTSTTGTDATTSTGSESTGGSESSGDPAPSCDDAAINQDETDIDCGGAVCAACGLDAACLADIDCASGWCDALVCKEPGCLVESDCDALDEPCVEASCDTIIKICVVGAVNEGMACEDGDLCTVGETCDKGGCLGGGVKDCSGLDNVCGVGGCDAQSGSCVAQAFPELEGDACDDGFVCTPGDVCAAGQCGVGGPGYLFYENFSAPDPGWELGPTWEFGPAMASPGGWNGADPAADHSPGDDNMVAGTIIGGLVPVGVVEKTCLISPVIDAGAPGDPGDLWLSFWRHLHTDYFPFAVHTVEAFDGQQWQEVEIGYVNPGVDDADWMFVEYDLVPFRNSEMRVRICHAQTQDAFAAAGWSLDDFTVGPYVCTPEA